MRPADITTLLYLNGDTLHNGYVKQSLRSQI